MKAALHQVARLFDEGTLNGLSDDILLDRFLDQGDGDAIAALIARHGPMVLGACLDVLGDPVDAEDAFQATFLTLLARARSIRGRDRVGGWLRRVAHRSALNANAERLRRRRRERAATARLSKITGSSVGESTERSELEQVIGAEIDRLPEQYRHPVVLCLLEGLPQSEAASRLHISEGVIRGRLARARALLRARLTRRGLAPHPSRTDALVVPATWVGPLLEAARAFNAPRAAIVGWGGLSLKNFAAPLCFVVILSLVPGFRETPWTPTTLIPVQPPSPSPRFNAVQPPFAHLPATNPGRTVVLLGRVLGPDGRPVAGARLSLVTDAWARAVECGSSGADGSYRIALHEATFRRNFTPSTTSPRVQIALIATAEGFGPGWKQLLAGMRDGQPAMLPEYAQDLHLAADRAIEGRVVDGQGKSVSGAILEVQGINAVTSGAWRPILDSLRKLDPSPLYYFPTLWDSPINRGAWAAIPPGATDAAGHFRLVGLGRDRRIDLRVTGPGIRPVEFSVMTHENVSEIARAVRDRYSRKRGPDGFFYTNYNTPPGVDRAVMIFDPNPTIEVERGRTVSGVVRNARTGEPLPRMRLGVVGRSAGSEQINADEQGRYRGTRGEEDSSIWVYAISDAPDRYLSAVREFTEARGLGEIVADFGIEPGVLITGRVLEAGTGRPIVSSTREDCHENGQVVAGRVEYFPLSNNSRLRATPTGLYFAGPPVGQNRNVSTRIDENGRFWIAVPPGPGVLLIKAEPGLPMIADMLPAWDEGKQFHRLFPYAPLTARASDDGAPGDNVRSFSGFSGSIPITSYHAYRVINPPADASTLSVELTIPRAPSRRLRFVGPDGHPVRGLTVAGMLPPPLPMISLDGSEAEALALDPARPRPLLALSHDGRYVARGVIPVAGPRPMPPRTITLEPASSVSGRLIDATRGVPLSRCSARVTYETGDESIPFVAQPQTTDTEGRFHINGLFPDLSVSIWFQEPPRPAPVLGATPPLRPESLRRLILHAREARDVGDVRVSLPK